MGQRLPPSFFDALYRHNLRLRAMELLREKYQLSFVECQGATPEVVRERQQQYDQHLGRLFAIWRAEDEEARRLDK